LTYSELKYKQEHNVAKLGLLYKCTFLKDRSYEQSRNSNSQNGVENSTALSN